MVNFRIFETDQFNKDLNQLFGSLTNTPLTKLHTFVYPQLRIQPYFGKNIKKLRNYEPDTWRYRIRGFRFFYTIDERKKMVFMVSADNREGAY